MKTSRVVIESTCLAIVSLIVGNIIVANEVSYLIPANYLPNVNELISSFNFLSLLLYLLTGNLIVVALEELLFRLAPYKVLSLFSQRLTSIVFWFFGAITSFLFSIIHTNLANGFEFPFVQFAVGLYFWSLIRHNKGYKLAVIGHFTYNAAILIFASFSAMFV